MIYKTKSNKHIDLGKIVMIDEVKYKYINHSWMYGFDIYFQLMDNPITLLGPSEVDGVKYTSEDIQDRKSQYEDALEQATQIIRTDLLEAWEKFINK